MKKRLLSPTHNTPVSAKYAHILKFINENKIKEMIEVKNYSPSMVLEFLIRENAGFLDDLHFSKNFDNLTSFRIVLNKNLKLNFNREKYNKMPNHWKFQFRFPENKSLDEIKKELDVLSRRGQKQTIEIRRKKGNLGNPKFKKEDSPLLLEFYRKRGISDKEAQETINKIVCDGAIACLKKTQKPKTEKIIQQLLKELNIDFICQFKINLKENEKKFRKKFYCYDFFLPQHKCVLECNGTYWHCDPRFVEEDKIINLPGVVSGIEARVIRERDLNKQDVAKNRGYEVIVIWEHDINNNLSSIRERLKNYGNL